jgi:hypothetical protein
LQFLYDFGWRFAGIQISQPPEISQIIITDVRAILLREQIGKNPILCTPGDDDRPISVLAQPLLKDSSTQIIGLPEHHLHDRRAKFQIPNQCFPRRLGKPRGLENPLPSFGLSHAALV